MWGINYIYIDNDDDGYFSLMRLGEMNVQEEDTL